MKKKRGGGGGGLASRRFSRECTDKKKRGVSQRGYIYRGLGMGVSKLVIAT